MPHKYYLTSVTLSDVDMQVLQPTSKMRNPNVTRAVMCAVTPSWWNLPCSIYSVGPMPVSTRSSGKVASSSWMKTPAICTEAAEEELKSKLGNFRKWPGIVGKPGIWQHQPVELESHLQNLQCSDFGDISAKVELVQNHLLTKRLEDRVVVSEGL